MEWHYEIVKPDREFFEAEDGSVQYQTEAQARNAGNERVSQLLSTGNVPADGALEVHTWQD